jgi:hypothetical protein
MGIRVMVKKNNFPQNLNRQIQRTTIHVQMEERDLKKEDNVHVLQPTNKENHQRIQTHKHRHSLQKHKHIKSTQKSKTQ